MGQSERLFFQNVIHSWWLSGKKGTSPTGLIMCTRHYKLLQICLYNWIYIFFCQIQYPPGKSYFFRWISLISQHLLIHFTRSPLSVASWAIKSLPFWYFMCSFCIKSTKTASKSVSVHGCVVFNFALHHCTTQGEFYLYMREFIQDRLHAYVSGWNSTHPPIALQGRDLLRQLRLNSLHDNS